MLIHAGFTKKREFSGVLPHSELEIYKVFMNAGSKQQSHQIQTSIQCLFSCRLCNLKKYLAAFYEEIESKLLSKTFAFWAWSSSLQLHFISYLTENVRYGFPGNHSCCTHMVLIKARKPIYSCKIPPNSQLADYHLTSY